MLNTKWSEILKSDLDKLSPLASAPVKVPVTKLKEGERRIVTILFLDIQGFTAMSEKLDPEDVQLIIDNCFKILTNEVEKYRGYIDKYEGDRMMALFGGREASEQDCECALRAALGMKEKFSEVNKILAAQDIQIGIRIGVNTGLVVTGRIGKGRAQDFTVMGDAVNLASRLESSAPPGEILVGDEVQKTAGKLFIYEDLGKIEVKGKSAPISVAIVKGITPARPERWERSPFTRRSRYVAREKEDQLLLSTAQELRKRRGFATVAVRAPAGTGKSRLTHEFLKNVETKSGKPPWVIKGEAVASHQTPYDLFSQLLSKFLSEKGTVDQVFSPTDASQRTEALRLRPVVEYLAGTCEADDRIQSLDPTAFRLEMNLAIRFVLVRLAALAEAQKSSPLIACLDSLQWLDQASTEVLDFLGANLTDCSPIFLLWSYRPEFAPKDEWRDLFELKEVTLKPLSNSECAQIIQSALEGEALSEEDQAILIRRSGGNPFFMEELIQSLIDSEVLSREKNRWVLTRAIDEASLPDTVQRVLVGRFDKLDQVQKEILMAASVIGQSIPISILEFVGEKMGMEVQGVGQRIAALEDLGFIYRMKEVGWLGSQLAFRHGLTQDVVYSMILNHNKKILHGLVGQAFEAKLGERAEDHALLLLHHYSHAGEAELTVRYGSLALDQMVRQHSTKEGLETISVLQSLLDEKVKIKDPERLKERLLDAEIRFYDFLGQRKEQVERLEALEEIEQSSDRPDLSAKVSLHRATYFSSIGDFREAREHAESGVKELESDPSPSKLRMDLLRAFGMACHSIGEQSEALDHFRQGLSIAEETQDRNAEGAFYNLMGLVHFNIGRSQEALDYYEKANALMRKIGDRRGEGNTLGNRGLVHWTLGDYSQALASLQESNAIFREIGFEKGKAVTLGNLGVIFQKFGQYEEALQHYESALEIHIAIHDRSGEAYDLVNIGETYRHLGEFSKAIEKFEAGKILAQQAGSAYLLAENFNCLGVVYRKQGESDRKQLEKAREYTEKALELATSNKLLPAEIKASSNLGRICWLLGDKEKGFQYSERAMKLLGTNTSGVEGSEEDAYVNHYTMLSEEGRLEEAEQYLKTLVELIQSRAKKIREDKYRKSFLTIVRQNRFVLGEWRKLGK